MTLKDTPVGKTVWIENVNLNEAEERRLSAMGIIGGTPVRKVKEAPVGRATEIMVYGYELALGDSITEKITVTETEPNAAEKFRYSVIKTPKSPKGDENTSKSFVFALLGNQNCGKSTLFNAITGGNQHIGNFAGVTVEAKTGYIKNNKDISIVDLPGTYSLKAYSGEEKTVKDFLKKNETDCIINIIDATNIERNLYLTTELVQLGIPMVIALNMMDEVCESGTEIKVEEIERQFGVRVIPISASKNDGVEAVVECALHTARCGSVPNKIEFPDDGATAKARYLFINDLCKRAVLRRGESRHGKLTEKIDRYFTGKYTAIPIFAIVMLLMFYGSFGLIGGRLSGFLEMFFEWIETYFQNLFVKLEVSPPVSSLVTDGVLSGIGSVLSFLPYILTLFFFLSLLEDSGYMARIAFIADGSLRKVGLSGKSIVPMLMGFGCTVPAVMASRTSTDKRGRMIAVMVTPFMSCTAKLPIYAYFAKSFFPNNTAVVIFLLYALGIVLGILYATTVGRKMCGGEIEPFIMELPRYRMPTAKTTFRLLKDKTKDFLQRAFSVIFLSAMVIWFLQYFDTSMGIASSAEESILAKVASWIAPIFKPLGFGDWRASTAVVSGVLAKESVVSTLNVLCPNTLYSVFDKASAAAFMVFCLLYTPCVAAVSAVSREVGGKMAAAMVVGRFAIAWIAAFFINILMKIIFI